VCTLCDSIASMNDNEATLPQQIAFLEGAVLSMHRDLLAATSVTQRAALTTLIKDTRRKIERLKRAVAAKKPSAQH
jgi:hypothetical protein